MDKTKVVAYCRVSTKKHEQDSSIVNQTEYFTRYCKDISHYDLIKIYDERVSGTKLDRPKLNQMLYDAGIDIEYVSTGEGVPIASDRDPKFNRILIKDTSRFARNTLAFNAIKKLRQKKVFIDFVNIGLTTEDVTSDLILKMLLTLDEEESKVRSRNVYWGHQRGMEQDIPVIPGLSYGYNKVDRKTLSINEEQAIVVQYIYNAYVNDNLSIKDITEECNNRKYKAKRGGKFNISTITLILKNPIYKGTLIRGKHDFSIMDGHKIDMLTVKDNYTTTDNHVGIPIIIDNDTWENAQLIMTSRAKGNRGVRKKSSKYARLLRCQKCGSSYHKNADRGRTYYVCSKKRKGGNKSCNGRNISESKLDKLVTEHAELLYKERYVKHINRDINKLEHLKKRIIKKANESIDFEAVTHVENKLMIVNDKKKALLTMLDEGLYSAVEIKDIATVFKQQITEFELELSELQKSVIDRQHDIDEINKTLNRLKSIELKDFYTEEVLADIDHILIGEISFSSVGKVNDIVKTRLTVTPIFRAFSLIESLTKKHSPSYT